MTLCLHRRPRTLFYLGGVLCSSLLVTSNDPRLATDDKTGRSSPFVIAFNIARWKVVRPASCALDIRALDIRQFPN